MLEDLSRRELYRRDEPAMNKISGEIRALEWSIERIHQYSLEENQLFQVK